MRATLVASVSALVLVVAVPAVAATTPTFKGTVGPGFTITMAKKPTKAGKIKLTVSDKSDFHNFPLTGPGVNVKTSGPVRWKLWKSDLSDTVSLIFPAFVGFFAMAMVKPGPTVPLNVGVVAATAGTAATRTSALTEATSVALMTLPDRLQGLLVVRSGPGGGFPARYPTSATRRSSAER